MSDPLTNEQVAAAYARVRLTLEKCAANGDTEIAHIEADQALEEFVRELGFGDVADAYDRVSKWYA